MKGIDLLETSTWQPLTRFNVNHQFFALNKETIIFTWIVLGLLFVFLFPIRWLLKRQGLARYMVLSFVQSFISLTEQTIGIFHTTHFYFITTLFLFIFACNLVTAIPWMEEPTKDLNTALAFGLISFLYIQFYSIKIKGIKGYLKEYLSPFFIMLPLNVIGKLSSLVSISFRLFGNIFGGAAISQIYLSAIKGAFIFEILGIITGLNILITLFFGIFEGFLQAFVFAMLTLTYLSMLNKPIATQGDDAS